MIVFWICKKCLNKSLYLCNFCKQLTCFICDGHFCPCGGFKKNVFDYYDEVFEIELEIVVKEGMHPEAYKAFLKTNIPLYKITQTIGNAKASAGTHTKDGEIEDKPYCAAIDLSVRYVSEPEICAMLNRLNMLGFVAFYRKPGFDHWPADEPAHIHAVYCGCFMKESLRTQVHDALHDKNGLKSHAHYEYWIMREEHKQLCRELFLKHNPPED